MEENRRNIFAANYRWIAALPYPPRRWFTLRVRSGLGFTPFSKANQSFSSPHKHRKFRNGDRVVAAKFIRVHIRRRRRRYAAQYSAFRVITFRVRDGAFRNNVADRTAFFFFFFFFCYRYPSPNADTGYTQGSIIDGRKFRADQIYWGMIVVKLNSIEERIYLTKG